MGFSPDTIAEGNICAIWVDDLIDVYTWRDTFGISIQTPNLDRFMQKAARFTNAYATVPLCAPCRAELATGLSPFRTGLVDLNRFWRDSLPPEKAWAYDLRKAGFYSFTTGKVDANYQPMPESYRRFLFHEDVEAKDLGGRKNRKDYLDRGPGISGINHPNDDGSLDDRFYDYWVAQNAIDFLNRADPSRRHLIQLGFKHPHYRLTTPDRFYQMYDVTKIKWPSIAAPEDYYGPQKGFGVYEAAYIANGQWTPEKAGDEAWRQVVRAYFAAISHMDFEFGRFMAALEASDFAHNTTVIFLSDNGFNLGNHDSFHKMSQWDSAAHIPFAIWHASMQEGVEIDTPISLHNYPKTIMQLAGLPPRPDWVSGQSLLPLINEEFGEFDKSKSPLTAVFGTLSVRPSVKGYEHYRYFRYPNGEEHVYDLVTDPGETRNLKDEAPIEFLREELVKAAADLGLVIEGEGVPLKSENAQKEFWSYGADVEKIALKEQDVDNRLWYMAGPDEYDLTIPQNISELRIATVVSRYEKNPKESKTLKINADKNTRLTLETSERVAVEASGSRLNDVMIGPKYAGASFKGGAGDDRLIAQAKMRTRRHSFFGEEGNDTLEGGVGKDYLDGGTGDDLIYGNSNNNRIIAGHGNDTIIDGEETSHIDLGPGRNYAILNKGDDVISCGAGINKIEAGEGAVTFKIAYGGVTIIDNWYESHRYELQGWPHFPDITVVNARVVRVRVGLSIVEILGVGDAGILKNQIVMV